MEGQTVLSGISSQGKFFFFFFLNYIRYTKVLYQNSICHAGMRLGLFTFHWVSLRGLRFKMEE